jgi:hypothetical protein
MKFGHILFSAICIYLFAAVTGAAPWPPLIAVSIAANAAIALIVLVTLYVLFRRQTGIKHIDRTKHDRQYYYGYADAQSEFALTSSIDKLRALWEKMDRDKSHPPSYLAGFMKFIIRHSD